MQNCKNLEEIDNMKILPDKRWNRDDSKALLMHSIHVYPAKFPPIIAEEAFNYASEEGVAYHRVADIFCGCGTVALEAKKRNISFWGCDINPVAVLITKAKINHYNLHLFQYYHEAIKKQFDKNLSNNIYANCYSVAPERLRYWFNKDAYKELYCLKSAIDVIVDNDVYLTAFHCIFSSILKLSSKWLQKSIKPQIDPHKNNPDVRMLYNLHTQKFLKAVKETNDEEIHSDDLSIVQKDFLSVSEQIKFDLIITSPPYVTSYEYADLHQLSSLWLEYTDDYKNLRKGSIGSTYFSQDVNIESLSINNTGRKIVEKLKTAKVQPARCKSIARYYHDMEMVVAKSARMINKNGMALFVIGDSEIKGIKLFNSRHLIESMIDSGFSEIKIGKRTIEKSMCVPFRDASGKFTKKQSSKNEIYHEEFIISGRIK